MAKDAQELADQAERLKALRKAKRVSQETAAHEIGVSVRAYRDWELARSGINDTNIKSVATYFETTADYIEYGEDRVRGATPDLMDALSRGDLLDRLATIEQIATGLQETVSEIHELLLDAEVVRLDATDRKQTGKRSRPTRPRRAA